MKTILFFLLMITAGFPQASRFYKYTTLYSSGVDYEIETLDYIIKVEADGGQVVDPDYLNDFILDGKANGYYDSLLIAVDFNWGIKKNSNNKIIKVYDLFNRIDAYGIYYSIDYEQTDTSKSPTYMPSDQNGFSGAKFDASNDVLDYYNMDGTNSIPQPLTAFNVVKPLSSLNGKNYIDNGDGRVIFGGGSGALYIYNGSVLSDTSQLVSSTAYIYTGIFSGTNSKIYRNNVLKMTGNAGTSGLGSYAGFHYYLGSSGASQYANVILYNFIVKKGVGNISNINTFLNSKYNIY